MKKQLFLLATLLMLAAGTTFGQQPSCSNDNAVESQVNSLVNRGWTELNRNFYWVNYILPPTPPYLVGTLEIQLVGPYCGPACTPVIEVLRYDANVKNNSGNCIWTKVD